MNIEKMVLAQSNAKQIEEAAYRAIMRALGDKRVLGETIPGKFNFAKQFIYVLHF